MFPFFETHALMEPIAGIGGAMRRRTASISRGVATLAVAILVMGSTAAMARLQPPTNDDFANAIIVPSIPYSNYVDGTMATSAPTDPLTCPDYGTRPDGATVWYAYTATKSMKLRADTEGSGLDDDFNYYNTILSVWTGQPGNLTPVACNDYTLWAGSQVIFDATKGVTYYFMLGTANGGSGGKYLSFDLKQVYDVIFSINPTGSVKDGVATVSGTIACTLGNLYSLYAFGYVHLHQVQASSTADASSSFGYIEPCRRTVTWEVSGLQTYPDPFTAGPADVLVHVYACDNDDFWFCVSLYASKTVLLQPAS